MKDTDPPPTETAFTGSASEGVSIEYLELEDKLRFIGGRVLLFPREGRAFDAGNKDLLACWSDCMGQIMRAFEEGVRNADGAVNPELGWSVDGLIGVWPKRCLYFEFVEPGGKRRLVSTHLHWFQRMDPVFREAHLQSITKPEAKLTLMSDALHGWRYAHIRPA